MGTYGKIRNIYILIVIIIGKCIVAQSLSYDISTGTLTDFNLSISESNTPGSYANGTEVWNLSGFVGRILYTGPPTTMTFSNSGPVASRTMNNRFYFTYLDSNGTSNTNSWKEFFLVVRAKGMRHEGADAQHDFSQVNTVIANEGESVSIPYGAGSERVEVGQVGYASSGEQGVYDGSNRYAYLYPYRHIWVDVTVIRTYASRRLKTGYYESHIMVSATGGSSYLLQLAGKYGYPWYSAPPSFYFKLEKTIEDHFPFSLLQTKNSVADALAVGTCTYHSEETAATIRFSSDREGTSDLYLLRSSSGEFFRYYLAFQSTNPSSATVAVTASTRFPTTLCSIHSVIDGSLHQMHVLEGMIKMYVPAHLYPLAGNYTTTIYCHVTHEE